MDDDSCQGKKSNTTSQPTPKQASESFKISLQNLFFKEIDLGLGIILEPDGKIHTITSNKGLSCPSVAHQSQLIPKADLHAKLSTLGKYAVISHYDGMDGSRFQIYPCQTLDELGETLDSSVGIKIDEGSTLKRIAVLGLKEDVWVKRPDEVKLKKVYTIE